MENSMTYVLNRYLVMDDFTLDKIFTQPLAGNGRLRRLRFPVSLDKMKYVSYFSYHTLPPRQDAPFRLHIDQHYISITRQDVLVCTCLAGQPAWVLGELCMKRTISCAGFVYSY
jgi:hypothetical protein